MKKTKQNNTGLYYKEKREKYVHRYLNRYWMIGLRLVLMHFVNMMLKTIILITHRYGISFVMCPHSFVVQKNSSETIRRYKFERLMKLFLYKITLDGLTCN